jgi:alanine dehydrogenase
MIIGVLKEIKSEEYRVAITPEGVAEMRKNGHEVLVEWHAGEGSGFWNFDYHDTGAYHDAGAKITESKKIWELSDMIMKVKEPQPVEYPYLKRPNLILFTYLHLAAFPELLDVLLKNHITGIDYATVRLPDGSLPLLAPMSKIAGRLAVQEGANYLKKTNGGKGILLGFNDKPGNILIIGGGTAGASAAELALRMGANVCVVEKNPERRLWLDTNFGGSFFRPYGRNWKCIDYDPKKLSTLVKNADILIGAVLINDALTPKVVTKEMVKNMQPGSVIVDIAIDEGGCIETSRPTTHDDPVYVKYGVTHYCVANIPGAVPRTSTIALTNATLPYALEIANKGIEKAISENPAILAGVNTHRGKIINKKLI